MLLIGHTIFYNIPTLYSIAVVKFEFYLVKRCSGVTERIAAHGSHARTNPQDGQLNQIHVPKPPSVKAIIEI